MIYRVLDGDTVVSEQTVRSTYRCWSADDVREEVEPFGLTATELVTLVRRNGSVPGG